MRFCNCGKLNYLMFPMETCFRYSFLTVGGILGACHQLVTLKPSTGCSVADFVSSAMREALRRRNSPPFLVLLVPLSRISKMANRGFYFTSWCYSLRRCILMSAH